MLYEPLVATVTLTNQAGRDVTFEDVGGKQWFNVEVTTLDGQVLQPYDRQYKLNPLTVPRRPDPQAQDRPQPAFSHPRTRHPPHARVNVYLPEADRYFASSYVTFDIAEGQLIWRQDVGGPAGEGVRQVSLLTFQRPDRLMLYARVRDGESGNTMYSTQALGRILSSGAQPEVMLDRQNTMHVLQEAMPSAFLYTQISVDGERLNQQAYDKVGTNRPRLEKLVDGEVSIHGGRVEAPREPGAAAPVREPKLSDRPAALPGAARKPADQ